MIWDGVGDWYGVDFTIGDSPQMLSFKYHTLKHHNQEQQIKDAIGKKCGVNPDSVKIYHAIRMIQA